MMKVVLCLRGNQRPGEPSRSIVARQSFLITYHNHTLFEFDPIYFIDPCNTLLSLLSRFILFSYYSILDLMYSLWKAEGLNW